jgi:xanthine dehydrogenase accessory factor
MQTLQRYMVLVRGAGDLATGVIARLHRAGFRVLATETDRPTVIRRAASFARAVYDGAATVDGLEARRASLDEAPGLLELRIIPVMVDPDGQAIAWLRPQIVVDAVVAKRNLGTRITDAPLVIALGPGFTAGVDAHAVIETNRGHDLGRVLWSGAAEPDTGIPGEIAGHGADRVLRSPAAGAFRACAQIGDTVAAGQTVAEVNGHAVVTPLAGTLRGLLQDGLTVGAGWKVGDVDPRATRANCFTISDKANAVAGGVLEAVLARLDTVPTPA